MTHTDDALVERLQELTETSITMTRKQLDSYDYIRWSLTNDIAQEIIAAVRQFDEQAALNCGFCTPNSDEIACGCKIEERDDG